MNLGPNPGPCRTLPLRCALMVPTLLLRPSVTIVTGGVTVTVSGTGFATRNISANNVQICGRHCAVTKASVTQLECTAPSQLRYPHWDGQIIHQITHVETENQRGVCIAKCQQGFASVQDADGVRECELGDPTSRCARSCVAACKASHTDLGQCRETADAFACSCHPCSRTYSCSWCTTCGPRSSTCSETVGAFYTGCYNKNLGCSCNCGTGLCAGASMPEYYRAGCGYFYDVPPLDEFAVVPSVAAGKKQLPSNPKFYCIEKCAGGLDFGACSQSDSDSYCITHCKQACREDHNSMMKCKAVRHGLDGDRKQSFDRGCEYYYATADHREWLPGKAHAVALMSFSGQTPEHVTAALVFRDLTLPYVTVPMKAVLRVTTASALSYGASKLRISAALPASCGPGAPAFQLADHDVTELPARATTTVLWEPVPWTGHEEESPDLSELIQELTTMPQWRDDGSCAVSFTITHVDGDGSRILLIDGTSLTVSYVVPSPLAQLGAVVVPKNCSFSLAVDANIVSPQSESYAKLRGKASRRASIATKGPTPDDEGKQLLENNVQAPVNGESRGVSLQVGSPGHRRVLASTCSASGWQLKDDVLMNEPIGTPPPLAVDITITPSLCQREVKSTENEKVAYPACALSKQSNLRVPHMHLCATASKRCYQILPNCNHH